MDRPLTRRRGLSLAETLVAVAVSAALFVAVAAALHACLAGYRVNTARVTLLQRARLAQARVTAAIRTAEAHTPLATAAVAQFLAGQTVTDTGIAVLDASGAEHRFRFDAPRRRLLAEAGGATRVLVEGVDEFSVTMEPMRSAQSLRTGGGFDCLRRASVRLSVGVRAADGSAADVAAEQTLRLTASAAPRRNAW